MLDEDSSPDAWSLLARWTLASSIGWLAGLAVGAMLTLAVGVFSWLNQDRFAAYAILVSLGITVGMAQWIVIRPYLPKPLRWITATLIGYLLCLVIILGSNLAKLGGTGLWNNLLLLSLLGAAIAAPQWWVLRRHYQQAGLWILVNMVGLLCFVWIIIYPSHSMGEFILRGTIAGTLAAVVPGAALAWLVSRPIITISPGSM